MVRHEFAHKNPKELRRHDLVSFIMTWMKIELVSRRESVLLLRFFYWGRTHDRTLLKSL
jgi:hypothetical protein